MSKPGFLVLEDGTVYNGTLFGAEKRIHGEVVFNTSMTGYQEILTDPSYAGQIVVPTYPLIGNYGVNLRDVESRRVQVRAFVVHEWCAVPSNGLSVMTIDEYLRENGVPGLSGVDTRAITRHVRNAGVMMGAVSFDESPQDALARLREQPKYDSIDFVAEVTTPETYEWEADPPASGPRVVVLDEGLKYNILRNLKLRGARPIAVPARTSAREIMALKPDGVVLSPGPGDPALLDYLAETTRGLIGNVPIMGICLGHQMVARAFGAKTYKLKFGHRGGNHPVREEATGKVHVTAQNHGYAVDGASLPSELQVSHINLNDHTVEGLRHRDLPVMTIQYHSEAAPGPRDNEYLFSRFLDMVATVKAE